MKRKSLQKMKKIIYLLLLILLAASCENSKKEKIEHNISGITLYELNCGRNVYFSLENCNCDKVSTSYFFPLGDNEYYYVIYLKNGKNKLEVYAPYNRIKVKGDILNKINLYDDIDNSFLQDSILKNKKYYSIAGTAY